jgi:hypothetical protein
MATRKSMSLARFSQLDGIETAEHSARNCDPGSSRRMDLPPQAIGAAHRYRSAPVGSDVPVIRHRVQEAPDLCIDDAVARCMILLMRSDLRVSLRIACDEPVQLRARLERAAGT